jgi:hypothetical protein
MAKRPDRTARFAFLVLLAALAALPATAAPKGRNLDADMLAHTSQSVAVRYWLAHPNEAPAPLQDVFRRAGNVVAQAKEAAAPSGVPIESHVLNDDIFGLPQNEESVSGCRLDDSLIIEGTNDYRGLLDSEGNFTGWHFSVDGGRELAKEGLLPAVTEGGTDTRPSGGDPVVSFSEADCDLYASSLNYDPIDPFANTNGVGIYKSDEATLLSAACDPTSSDLSDEDCWPTRRYAAFSSDPTHFLDKEWFDVGDTGDGEHVWVTYSDFDMTPTPPNPAGFTAEIFAVRCDADLVSCTAPIPVSEDDVDVQFSDVTIGPDQRTYVTWAQIFGELEGTAQTFVIKMRVAEPGSTTFGPERIVFEEDLAIPFGGFLHANDFRVATYPKHEVRDLGGDSPRVYVVWDACEFRVLDNIICEEPIIWLSYSDDLGVTWSDRVPISDGGDNYFPAIAFDPDGNRLVAAWFTNQFDTRFHNRNNVELVSLNVDGAVRSTKRITRPSNETEADPLLGGFFIGDYIEVFAHDETAWVGYNANYRQVQLLFEGIPISQQDNYLKRTPL